MHTRFLLFYFFFSYTSNLMHSEFQSQSQCQSDRAYVDLGLLLTQKVLSTKTRLKEINPTLIYEWDGQTINNQISGKGTFLVRNSFTNQLLFQCEVKKWKNGVPDGSIKMKKVNLFTSEQLTDYKVKEIHLYQGGSQNLKKHGNGTYTIQEFYSSGKVKKSTISGQWSYDILVKGVLENELGKKELSLNKNMEWSKSTKSINLQMEKPENTLPVLKDDRNNQSRPLKQSTNLLPEPISKYKYLDPNRLK